jgi:hypothetical protein
MQRIEEMMDWIPIVLITFKLLVLGTAMFFSIKSHHDKQKEEQEEERARQARASGTGRSEVEMASAIHEATRTADHAAVACATKAAGSE